MSYVYTKNKLELIDGSLTPVSTVPEDMVLVIERAYSGPTDQLYLVQDLTEAKLIYGDKSPLINLASRTMLGQAENIALFRIGGGAYSFDNVFGPGSNLRLTEASATAADNLKIYIGPEPKNTSRDAVIIWKNNRIIYSNVIGGEIASSLVAVSGFSKQNNELRVGSLKSPVPLADLIKHIGGEASTTVAATQTTVDTVEWVSVDVSSIAGFTSENSLESIQLKDALDEVVTYTVSDDKTQLLIEAVDGSNEVNVGDTLTVSFVKTLTEEERLEKGITFTKGKDSINASYKEIYEELDRALESLELLPTKAVVVGDLFDIPTIANGSKETNRLTYLIKGEDEYGYPTYDWSDHKYIYKKEGADETTTDITEAELSVNNEPIVVREYNEVDFTHRLGMFAYDNLEEGDFLNVIIGSRGPKFTNPKSINDWIGKEPVRDLAGNIVENGTGLLGHRLMVGSTSYRGGYFATSNGFVDGDILTDRTGFAVDLGKHLSIVVSQVGAVSTPVLVTSAAATYGGLVSTLLPGESTTNKTVPNMFSAFTIKEGKRKALAKNGYVVFFEKSKGLTVYSGDVATRENSDYDFISTANTVASITRLIKDTVDPYVGKGTDFILITALHTALVTALGNAQRAGWMNSYTFRIRRDGPNSLLIPFKIEAKDELREVNSLVRLTRPDDLNL